MVVSKIRCPGCQEPMRVGRLHCETCRLTVEGSFDVSPLASLAPGEQEFVVAFVRGHGSIKNMERLLGLSYPTVKKRLAGIAERLSGGPHGGAEDARPDRSDAHSSK